MPCLCFYKKKMTQHGPGTKRSGFSIRLGDGCGRESFIGRRFGLFRQQSGQVHLTNTLCKLCLSSKTDSTNAMEMTLLYNMVT